MKRRHNWTPADDALLEARIEAPVKPPRRTAVYPFPLDGFMAQLVIPLDLGQAEAARLQAFIASLVVPWSAFAASASTTAGTRASGPNV